MLVNAVVYFKVVSSEDVIIKIEDHVFAVRQYTQAALRDVIGNSEMDFVLTENKLLRALRKSLMPKQADGGLMLIRSRSRK